MQFKLQIVDDQKQNNSYNEDLLIKKMLSINQNDRYDHPLQSYNEKMENFPFFVFYFSTYFRK